VERLCDGGEEGFVVEDVGGGVWFGAGAQDDDDELLTRVDVEMLAKDSDALEGALMNGVASGEGPPEVAVVHGLATNDVSGAGFAEPAFGNDALTVENAVLLNEQAEAAIIAQGCAEAAAGEPHSTGRFEPPGGILLHAEARPESLRKISGERLVGGAFEQRSHEEGFASAVIPDGAGSTGPGQSVHVGDDGAGFLRQLEFEELSAIGLGVGVGLVPLHSGSHLQDIANADALVSATLELGDVTGQRVVEAGDEALLQGRADERGGKGFRDGEGGPAGLRAGAEFVVFEDYFAVLEDEQSGDAIVSEVVEEVEGVATGFEMNVGALRYCGWEGANGALSRNGVDGKESVAVLEGGYLDVREHLAVKHLACAGALLRWSGGAAKGENERDEYAVPLPMRVGDLEFLGYAVFHGPDSMKRC